MSVASTDSTNTFSSEENSNSSSSGRTSFTAQHCRPHRTPTGRFSGYLSQPHEEIDRHAAYATTRSGPEPNPDMMAEQLDRVYNLVGQRRIELGILPFGAQLRRTAPHAFWIYDRRLVIVETISEELWLTGEEGHRTVRTAVGLAVRDCGVRSAGPPPGWPCTGLSRTRVSNRHKLSVAKSNPAESPRSLAIACIACWSWPHRTSPSGTRPGIRGSSRPSRPRTPTSGTNGSTTGWCVRRAQRNVLET